jgi:hypothetical protein
MQGHATKQTESSASARACCVVIVCSWSTRVYTYAILDFILDFIPALHTCTHTCTFSHTLYSYTCTFPLLYTHTCTFSLTLHRSLHLHSKLTLSHLTGTSPHTKRSPYTPPHHFLLPRTSPYHFLLPGTSPYHVSHSLSPTLHWKP